MESVKIVITSASYSGNKGAAAMLQSSIQQLYDKYGERLQIILASAYPDEDINQIPWDFVELIPVKPKHQAIIDFPLAIIYNLFKKFSIVKKLLLKDRLINAYENCTLVIDEAGISFADNLSVSSNISAFVRMVIPLLIGKPVIKYSQALGTFHKFHNRFVARLVLPRLDLICARGNITYKNLTEIGIKQNVKICADGAFSMQDSVYWKQYVNSRCREDIFFDATIVGISISSVVEKRCEKNGIDYCGIICRFISFLNKKGYSVLLIANAARINNPSTTNNDLWTGDKIFANVEKKELVRWFHEEMSAEEIREYIGKCKYLVASRFHAMIGALEREVPVLLIGWSHKYQEILDMFELGRYATDFSNLTIEELIKNFEIMEADTNNIIKLLKKHHDTVVESSKENINLISQRIDKIMKKES